MSNQFHLLIQSNSLNDNFSKKYVTSIVASQWEISIFNCTDRAIKIDDKKQ